MSTTRPEKPDAGRNWWMGKPGDCSDECIRDRSGFTRYSSSYLYRPATEVERLCTREWSGREGQRKQWSQYCMWSGWEGTATAAVEIIGPVHRWRYCGFCSRIQLLTNHYGSHHGWAIGMHKRQHRLEDCQEAEIAAVSQAIQTMTQEMQGKKRFEKFYRNYCSWIVAM